MFCRNPMPFLLSCLFLACATVHRAPSTPTLYDTDTQPPRTNKNQKKKLSAAAQKKRRLRKLLWQIGVPIASAAVVALIGGIIVKKVLKKIRIKKSTVETHSLSFMKYADFQFLYKEIETIGTKPIMSWSEKIQHLNEIKNGLILLRQSLAGSDDPFLLENLLFNVDAIEIALLYYEIVQIQQEDQTARQKEDALRLFLNKNVFSQRSTNQTIELMLNKLERRATSLLDELEDPQSEGVVPFALEDIWNEAQTYFKRLSSEKTGHAE